VAAMLHIPNDSEPIGPNVTIVSTNRNAIAQRT
jgi:hypothetical protein